MTTESDREQDDAPDAITKRYKLYYDDGYRQAMKDASEALGGLVEKWREEGQIADETKKSQPMWAWSCHRWRIAVMFLRGSSKDSPLDPYAIGFGDGTAAAAKELTETLERMKGARQE